MINAIISNSEFDIKEHQLSNSRTPLNYVKILFISIASIHLINVILFFINTWFHINNHYSFFSVSEFTSLISILGIILYVLSFRKKSLNFKLLFDLWIFGILISKCISIITLNLYSDANIKNELSIWLLVISMSICLFITGSYLNSNFIKIISVLFIVIQFVLNLLPNISLSIKNGQILSISLSPLFFNILAFMIFIFLYRYIYTLENKYTKTE